MTVLGKSLSNFGRLSDAAPGQITNLTTPTQTGTSFLANFTAPSGSITSYQYRINGGTATPLGGGPGTEITGQTTGLAVDVEVRAMNGSTPGPWSNMSVGDPGITVNAIFDTDVANLDGHSNGSWKNGATNVFITGGPNISCGFASAQDVTDATTTVNNMLADLRKLINSTGKINFYFGMGRYQRQSTGVWLANNSGSNALTWAGGTASDLANYAAYTSKIGSLPSDQKALWPGGGTLFDPGAFPNTSGTYAVPQNLNAIWTNNTSNTIYDFICWDSSYSWDCDPNPNSCDGSKLKLNFGAWHEPLQAMGVLNITGPITTFRLCVVSMLGYTASSTLWDPQTGGTPYYSITAGSSPGVGLIQLGVGTDVGSLSSIYSGANASALAYINPGFGGTGIPTTHCTIPGGRNLPLRSQDDAKFLCAMFPPSAALKTMAGL